MTWSPFLQVTSWTPAGTGHCCLTCLPGTNAPSPACLSTVFSGRLWAACWKHPHICPRRDMAHDHTQSIVVRWAPPHTFGCAHISGCLSSHTQCFSSWFYFYTIIQTPLCLNPLWLDTTDLQQRVLWRQRCHIILLKIACFYGYYPYQYL